MTAPKDTRHRSADGVSHAFRRLKHSTFLVVEDALLDGLGNLIEAVYLSKLLYWDQYADADGWFTRTGETIARVTLLTRRQQDAARKSLVKRGLVETRLLGMPAQLHYRIDWDAVISLVAQTPPRPEGYERDSFDPESVQTSLYENAKLDRTDPPNSVVQKRQSLTIDKQEERKKKNGISPGRREDAPLRAYPPLSIAEMHKLDPVADRALILRATFRPQVPAGTDIETMTAWSALGDEWERRKRR